MHVKEFGTFTTTSNLMGSGLQKEQVPLNKF
jgi:hypothetical protein